jgi:hypothetical protein
MFYPKDNIKRLTTKEARGLLLIEDAGRGKDVKGVLTKPIRLEDYPLPWEFHLGMLQPEPKAGEKQNNYAMGVNVAVTFSDPSTWPKDRTRLPPDTHSLQLFVVRLGNYGEIYRDGVPQLRYSALNYGDPSPEVYLLVGRGDLAPNVVGDWRMPYTWLGYQPPQKGQFGAAFGWSWEKYGGPAESGSLQDIRFRVRAVSPTELEIGFGFGYKHGWRMRTIDVSRFGKITGIWEIGPIFSLDRWMADDLAPRLKIDPPPSLEPPNPESPYYIDYALFYGQSPENFEHLSNDFDVPGVHADHKLFIEGDGMAETWSHPGYLTVTFSGKRSSWAMCPMCAGEMTAGLGYIELSRFKPPMELELAFVAPDDRIPWNLLHSFGLVDEKGKLHGWSPGIQNFPGKGRRYVNQYLSDPAQGSPSEINPEFGQEVPQSLLTHKPLRLLLQIVDESHLRVGLKGSAADPWLFSKVFDTGKVFGKIAKFQLPCVVATVGQKGSAVGNYPHHLQFLIDYVHYRYGLTK